MPPRPPPPPGDLTVLQTLAALAAVWVTAGVDQCLRGLIGMAMGIAWRGITLDAAHGWVPLVVQGPGAPPTIGGVALVALAGSVAAPLLALGMTMATTAFRSSGLLRGFALAWLVVSCLWLPTALAAAAMPNGAGPVAELYQRLGEPQAGRWTALALGCVLLGLLASPLSGVAIGIGRSWMRADGVEFRRRLVRVVAGWPGLVAVGALLGILGWARTPWLLPWPLAVLAMLHFRTR